MISHHPAARGFTIVELVVVIVLMGILSIGTVGFIGDSSQGYASTIRRTELASTARATIERLGRDLRDVLPNSVRVSGADCMEFVPVTAASTFLDLPVANSASSFKAAPMEDGFTVGSERVAVYPDDASAVYNLTIPAVISPLASISAPDGNNRITVTMASAHRFPAESPGKRFFMVEQPVSYCLVGTQLWRYSSYGYNAVQPNAAGLPTIMPGRSLVGESVSSDTNPFTISDATLLRNGVVTLDLSFTESSDVIRINHQIQLRNVP